MKLQSNLSTLSLH